MYIYMHIAGVGKTSILEKMRKNTFTEEHYTTVGVDFNSFSMEIFTGKRVKLQIWDAVSGFILKTSNLANLYQAGQDSFRSIIQSFYQNAAAIFLIYDVTE